MPLKKLTLLLLIAAVSWISQGESVPADRNLLTSGVIVTGSSFYGIPAVTVKTSNYFDKMYDGKAATCWRPMDKKAPHWLEFRWRYPLKINKFSWNSTGLSNGALSYWQNGKWHSLKKINGNSGTIEFPEVATDRLRLNISRAAEDIRIFELGAYGPAQIIATATFPEKTDSSEKFKIDSCQVENKTFAPGDKIKILFELSTAATVKNDYYFLVDIREKSLGKFRNYGDDFMVTGTVVSSRVPTSSWVPGKKYQLSAELTLPEYAPARKTALSIMALRVDDTAFASITGDRFHDNRMAEITIKQTAKVRKLQDYPAASLSLDNGQKVFNIGGEPRLPFFMRYLLKSDFERFYYSRDSTIDLQYFMAYAACLGVRSEWQLVFDRMDQNISNMLRVRPNCYFLIGLDLRPSHQWRKENQREMMRNALGQVIKDKRSKSGAVSYGSRKYRKDCDDFIKALFAFLKTKPYAGRIIGWHPWSCTALDAFIGGVQNNTGQGDRDKILIGDFHPDAIERYRQWLRARYNNSLPALRKAWGKPDADFATAVPDAKQLVAEDIKDNVFRDPVKSRAVIDYLEFLPTLIGGFHQEMAAIIKRESDRKTLVMLHYGAILHCLRRAQPSGSRVHSSNYDAVNLLNDDNIDMYVQATPYDSRHAGMRFLTYQAIGSINLHDKMYLVDYDVRTFSSGTLLARHRSAIESKAIIQRDLAMLMTKNAGAWLSDMGLNHWRKWEEYGMHWFARPEITSAIREVLNIFRKEIKLKKREPVSEIAVFVSADTVKYEDAMNSVCIYRNLVSRMMYNEFTRLGAPYDIYFMADLTNPKLRNDYKLYVFINPFFMTETQRRAVDALKCDGKTMLWFYAPGYGDSAKGLDVEAIAKVTGMKVKVKPDKEFLQMTVVKNKNVLTGRLEGREFKAETYSGVKHLHPESIKPVFYIDDKDATVIARFPDGKTAWAARDFGSWKSIYSVVPFLDLQAIRNIADYAGVHLYCREDITMSADNRFLVFDNGYEKEKTLEIFLRKPQTIRDAFTGKIISSGKKSFKLHFNTPETKILTID